MLERISLYVDGSFCPVTKCGAGAAVLINSSGKTITEAVESYTCIANSDVAEHKALSLGVRTALLLDIEAVDFFTDNMSVLAQSISIKHGIYKNGKPTHLKMISHKTDDKDVFFKLAHKLAYSKMNEARKTSIHA